MPLGRCGGGGGGGFGVVSEKAPHAVRSSSISPRKPGAFDRTRNRLICIGRAPVRLLTEPDSGRASQEASRPQQVNKTSSRAAWARGIVISASNLPDHPLGADRMPNSRLPSSRQGSALIETDGRMRSIGRRGPCGSMAQSFAYIAFSHISICSSLVARPIEPSARLRATRSCAWARRESSRHPPVGHFSQKTDERRRQAGLAHD